MALPLSHAPHLPTVPQLPPLAQCLFVEPSQAGSPELLSSYLDKQTKTGLVTTGGCEASNTNQICPPGVFKCPGFGSVHPRTFASSRFGLIRLPAMPQGPPAYTHTPPQCYSSNGTVPWLPRPFGTLLSWAEAGDPSDSSRPRMSLPLPKKFSRHVYLTDGNTERRGF